MSLYDTLGIDKKATQEDIKLKYRDLAKMLHPDKNSNIKDNERFLEITKAYNVLKDSVSRDYYDNTGKTIRINIDQLAKTVIASNIQICLQRNTNIDPIKTTRHILLQQEVKLGQIDAKLSDSLSKIQLMIKNLKHRKKNEIKDEFIVGAFSESLKSAGTAMENNKEQLEITKKSIELLDQWEIDGFV